MKLFPVLEEIGVQKQTETEVVIYAIVGQPNNLTKAESAEHHEQVERTLQDGTRQRIRKVTKPDGVKYFFTTKQKIDTGSVVQGFDEQTVEVNEKSFIEFKEEAQKVIYKTRFIFHSEAATLVVSKHGDELEVQLQNVRYEVDVFENAEGVRGKWCKIDVEVDGILDQLKERFPFIKEVKLRIKVSHLPFEPNNVILTSDKTPEQEALLSHLWDTQFSYPLQ